MTKERRLEQHYRPGWWRLIAYLAAVLPFLFLVASLWIRPHFKWQETPDWKPVVALADLAWERRDLYEAQHLYTRAGRIASWREEWQGLIAAACGMSRLDGEKGPYSASHTFLLRAMIASEVKRSRTGIAAVAGAFSALGEHKAAAMVLGRMRADWPEEIDESADIGADCWKTN